MKLLDQVHAACRLKHLAPATEQVYARWIEDYLRFHLGALGVRSPLDAVGAR
jgi:hypothetical protein